MKNAIITGASSGIGLEICRQLLENNVKVAGWSRSSCELSHPDFRHFSVDITDIEAVKAGIEETMAFFDGPPAFLINNAGLGYFGKLEQMPVDEWKRMFDVNVHGLFYTTRMVLPEMKKANKGHIVNIASTAGKVGIPEATGYCATKFAVRGLSDALYKEVKKHGIKVTCVFPGAVKTAFFQNYPAIEPNDTMMQPGDVAQVVVQQLFTPDGINTSEIEIRPMHPDYRV